MIRALISLLPFIALVLFPWWVAAAAAIFAAFAAPVVPLLTGIFADMLYAAPYAAAVPFLYTLLGAGVSVAAFLIRVFVKRNMRAAPAF